MSKLKTVWDAVNELRGNLNNTPNFSGGEMYLFHFVNHDRIGSSYGKHGLDGVINHICTVDEFNALVEDMTLGLDVNPVNHGHYLNYVNADKTLLEKETKPDYTSEEFWKDAPEGATHHCGAHNGFSEVWIKELKEDSYSFRVVGNLYAPDEWGCTYPIVRDELKYLTPRPQPKPVKPVYTQEMADNGVLPSVGSEFLHKGSVATTLSTSKEHGGVVTFTVDNGCSIDCCWNNGAWVKPIDTRTKKEKAIDEIESELSKIAYSTRSALELAYDEWVGE